MNKNATSETPKENAFVAAGEEKEVGIISEVFYFLKTIMKYWMLPILLTLLLLGALIILGGTSAAPFIYTLF